MGQPLRRLRADEAVVQAPPGAGGHHRGRAADADHAPLGQDVRPPLGRAGHAERNGAGVGVPGETLGNLDNARQRGRGGVGGFGVRFGVEWCVV